MAKDTIYTAIDVGTTKVCSIVAQVGADGVLQVLGLGVAPSQGVQKGMVVNIRGARDAIRASLAEARRYTGRGVSWAYVGVSGTNTSSMFTTGSLKEPKASGALSKEDLDAMLQASYPRLGRDQEVLHVLPRTYKIDGLRGVRNPVGLQASEAEVESHVITANAAALIKLRRAVEKSGIGVRRFVMGPLAAGEACLTEDEREMGVVLVEIGGGTTDIAIFRGGHLWYSSTVPVGGYHLTRDLAVALSIPYYFAEEAKLQWGHVFPEIIDQSEEVLLPGFQGAPRRTVSRGEICIPLKERLVETLNIVLLKLREAGLERLPPGGMVITGGTAAMAGLEELAKRLIPGVIRIGQPRGVAGLPQELRNPAYSTSVGILLWGIRNHGEPRIPRRGGDRMATYRSLPRRWKTSATSLWKQTYHSVTDKVKRMYTYTEENGDKSNGRMNDYR